MLPWLCSCPEQGRPVPPAKLTEQLAQGKILYEQSCAQCHYDGAGTPVAPDLRGSSVLAEPPQALARIILDGRQGVSMKDGKKLNGIMPPQAYLRDEEIAAVVVYVREAFGDRREALSPAAVAEIRAGLKD